MTNSELRSVLEKIWGWASCGLEMPERDYKKDDFLKQAETQILALFPPTLSESEIEGIILAVISYKKDTNYEVVKQHIKNIAHALSGRIRKEPEKVTTDTQKYCECGVNRIVSYGGSLTQEQIYALPCGHCGKPLPQPDCSYCNLPMKVHAKPCIQPEKVGKCGSCEKESCPPNTCQGYVEKVEKIEELNQGMGRDISIVNKINEVIRRVNEKIH